MLLHNILEGLNIQMWITEKGEMNVEREKGVTHDNQVLDHK